MRNKIKDLLKIYRAVLRISEITKTLTVRRHIKNSAFPHIKVGRFVRIPKICYVFNLLIISHEKRN